MKENEEITNLERFELLIEDCKGHRELYGESFVGEYDIEIMQHILSDYKRVLKENKELKNKIMEKELEIIGKEEYTKASMGEIIKQYYTANEDCITKQKVKDKIERLKKKRMKKYDNYMGYKIESREQQDIDKKINVLQELIEEREENNGKNI